MPIYPRDLGAKRYVAVLNRRAHASARGAAAGAAAGPDPFYLSVAQKPRKRRRARRQGILRRFWVRGLRLDAATEAEVLAGLADAPLLTVAYVLPICLFPFLLACSIIAAGVGGPWALALWLAGSLSLIAWSTLLLPRTLLRQTSRRPLTPAEADVLLADATLSGDRLERTYLGLARDAVRLDETVSLPPATEDDVRAALRTLGDAVSALPPVSAPARSAGALMADAAGRRAQAATEPDPVISASLLRQAAGLEQRARLVAPVEGQTRRAGALRRELGGHVETLRTGLATFAAGETNADSVKHLAQAVGRVAGHADAVQQARGELLDDELAAVLPAAASANGTTTIPAAAPAPPIVQSNGAGNNGAGSGPWWRGSS